MPMWRCPYCGAPQPESSRCWVCKRSSTNCSTCLHFRRSVAGSLGYCGLERRRALTGDEIRGCWLAGAPEPRPGEATPWTAVGPGRGARPGGAAGRGRLDFVPVGDHERPMAAQGGGDVIPGGRTVPPRLPTISPGPLGFRLSLWDDAEA